MIGALLLAAACSGDCRAQALFAAMERRLQRAPLQLQAESHASGAVRADATTEIFVGPMIRLRTRGAFMNKPFARDYDEPATPELRDAVVIGLARMGVLHNAINLSQGNPPDHATGGTREWLSAQDFRRAKGGVSYALAIDGKPSGEVTLLIDRKTRLPRKRTMVVHFPQGDMSVSETYRYPKKR